jgi:DNA polymerase-3 subunit delta'
MHLFYKIYTQITREFLIMTDIPHPNAAHLLYGHEQTEQLLLRAANGNKTPHAWLFSGPKGIGKATLCYRFARYILSPNRNPDTLDITSSSAIFEKIRSNGHGDLLVIEAEEGSSTIKVDEARKIAHFLHMTASETSHRVVIIDSVDDMNPSAANAILKLLEEPPAHALLLLISHNPGKLLPTIRSRCRHIRMSTLSNSCVEQILHSIAPQCETNDIRQIAPLSEGSAGFSLALLAGDGLRLYHTLLDCMSSWPNLNPKTMLACATVLSDKKQDTNWALGTHCLLWLLSTLIRINAVRCTTPTITGREEQILTPIAHGSSLEKLIELWENARQLIAQTDGVHLDKRTTILLLLDALRHTQLAKAA